MLTLAMLPVAGLQAATDQDIQVRVKKNGPEVAVDVDCPVNASAAVTWEEAERANEKAIAAA